MASRALLLRSPVPLVGLAGLLSALLVGALMAHGLSLGLGLLVAVCYAPLVLVNLPLGLALWVALLFIEHLPLVSIGPNAAAVLIVVAWLGALRWRGGEMLSVLRRRPRLVVGLALLLTWITISMAWAGDPEAAAEDVWRWYVAALVFVVVATTASSAHGVRLVSVAFIAGAVVSVAVGLVDQGLHSSATALETATQTEGRLQGGGGDPNYLAAGLVPAMALAGGLAAGTAKPWRRFTLLVAIGFLAIGLAATGSRGGLIAALVMLPATVAVSRGHRGHAVLACAIVVSVAGVALAASPAVLERVTSFDGGGNGRADLWQVGWRMAGDHPLVGVGVNNFRSASSAYVQEPGVLQFVDLISERPHVVHSVYIQLLAEEGAIGLALFLVGVLGCLATAWRAARRFDAAGERALAALSRSVVLAILGSLVASAFISNATDKRVWVLLALGPALLAVADRSPQEP